MTAPPKKAPGATLAGATGQGNYGRLYALARRLQAFVRRSAEEVVLLLEAFCARIETKHEIRKWNRALERDTMSDAQRIKQLLLGRVAQLAQHLYRSGHREGVHWCVGSIEGEAGKSFKICIAGPKAGLWGDFAESGKHSRSLLDLWMAARNVDFKTALRQVAEWLGEPLNRSSSWLRDAQQLLTRCGDLRLR